MTYGKSNEETSFLYDRLYTYKTTIAGQLFICMWAERMVEAVPELKFIQINTDGITIQLPKDKVELIQKVCNQLTQETTLEIEEAYYKQMIIRDVNNYIAEYQDSTKEKPYIKYKGCFEIDKEYHKNSSMRIVPLAISNYYLYNIPVEETIKNHKNIYDFCIRLKINSSSKAEFHYIDGSDFKKINLNRTTRYYISKGGGGICVYYNNSNKMNVLNRPYSSTIFNKYVEKENYNIDYRFYIRECMKIINSVNDGQLKLF